MRYLRFFLIQDLVSQSPFSPIKGRLIQMVGIFSGLDWSWISRSCDWSWLKCVNNLFATCFGRPFQERSCYLHQLCFHFVWGTDLWFHGTKLSKFVYPPANMFFQKKLWLSGQFWWPGNGEVKISRMVVIDVEHVVDVPAVEFNYFTVNQIFHNFFFKLCHDDTGPTPMPLFCP